MYHTIQFKTHMTLDLEVSANRRLEKLRIRKGTRIETQLKPYVVEAPTGPREVADLFLADGTTARSVPFEVFEFLE